jgi:hypothetical protein
VKPEVFGKVAALSTSFFDCPSGDDDQMVLPTYRRMLAAADFQSELCVYLFRLRHG